MKTRLASVAVLAGVLAVAVLAPSASTAGHSAKSGTTLHYRVLFAPFNVLDLGKKGPSAGDEMIFHDVLVDASGKRVGHDGFVCTVTNPVGPEAECTLTLSLPGGIVTTQFLNSPPPLKVAAITGGTGRYVGARGEVTIVESSRDQTGSVTVELK